jgi:hypothetical protein
MVRTINELNQCVRNGADADIAALLDPLVKSGLMIRDQKSYLSLAIPLGVYQPRGAALRKFFEVLDKMGLNGSDGDLTVSIPDDSFSAMSQLNSLSG